jgi:hypothetical protein
MLLLLARLQQLVTAPLPLQRLHRLPAAAACVFCIVQRWQCCPAAALVEAQRRLPIPSPLLLALQHLHRLLAAAACVPCPS